MHVLDCFRAVNFLALTVRCGVVVAAVHGRAAGWEGESRGPQEIYQGLKVHATGTLSVHTWRAALERHAEEPASPPNRISTALSRRFKAIN